jgi:hypothetical protein
MKIRNFASSFVLLCYIGITQAGDLEMSLEKCLSEPAQVTDIEFIAPHYALMTTQLGDVYWFRGCHRPAQRIGHVNVARYTYLPG